MKMHLIIDKNYLLSIIEDITDNEEEYTFTVVDIKNSIGNSQIKNTPRIRMKDITHNLDLLAQEGILFESDDHYQINLIKFREAYEDTDYSLFNDDYITRTFEEYGYTPAIIRETQRPTKRKDFK